MNDETREPEDLGEPIDELRLLDEDPPEGFLGRVRGNIQRRLFAGHVIDFGLRPLGEILLQYLVMIVSVFSTEKPTDERSDDER